MVERSAAQGDISVFWFLACCTDPYCFWIYVILPAKASGGPLKIGTYMRVDDDDSNRESRLKRHAYEMPKM